jgi:hypothetical protein
MSRNDVLYIDNLDKWENWLKGLEEGNVDRFKDRVLRTSGLRTLEYVDDLTPRRAGPLQNSAQVGDKNNVFRVKVGKTSYVVVGTTVKYARYVEEGFQQKAGRFVPGYWSDSGTFHYQPGYPSGMVLTGKFIEGAHMYRKALDYLQDDMDQIVEFEFRRLYAELFK